MLLDPFSTKMFKPLCDLPSTKSLILNEEVALDKILCGFITNSSPTPANDPDIVPVFVNDPVKNRKLSSNSSKVRGVPF